MSIRKSVTPDYLICLDDGLKFRSLRLHLTTLGMTPEQYRLKWNLPGDYPMVASNYAAQRSALAKKIGLGQLRKKPVAAVPVSVDTIEVVTVEPSGTKRKAKAKAKSKVVAAAPAVPVKRNPGRPRKTTA